MIRCVTYNVSAGLDLRAAGQVLDGLGADVVGILEGPSRRGLRRLASGGDLHVAARGGGRRLPVALLVSDRVRVLSHHAHDLETPGGGPDRVALHAILGAGGLRLSVIVTQLGLRPEVRQAHAQEIEAILAKVDAEPVLLGDLNEAPGGEVVKRFSEVLDDSFVVAGEGRGESYPTPDPSVRQDYVFVGRDLTVLRSWVHAAPPVDVASHHRPVVVELAGRDEATDPSQETAA
ncbi:MAG: endonuclease/exonuclease/phosphatase family protein [Nitriliruptorales bacterium]|nr:endonuclease/exonuclease/phosphatase family protein [Nitriliruptorales bacterium]